MSFDHFTHLPLEVQLLILDNLPTPTLLNLLIANKYLNQLTIEVLIKRTHERIINQAGSISTSLYCPQHKRHQIEHFTAVNVSKSTSFDHSPMEEYCPSKDLAPIDLNEVNLKLEELQHQSNYEHTATTTTTSNTIIDDSWCDTILQFHSKTSDPFKEEQSNLPFSSKIPLQVHEDEPYIKLHWEFKYGSSKSLCKVYTKIDTIEDINQKRHLILYLENEAIEIQCQLSKLGEIPPQFGYDYETLYDYELELGDIKVKNGYLLTKIENVM